MSGLSEEHPAQLPARRDPYAAFRNRSYRFYSAGNFVTVLGRQMLGVTVLYEIYHRTKSATALGLIGLAGALPIILLALPAGQIADRFNRRSVIITAQLVTVLTSLALALLSWRAADVPILPVLDAANGVLLWTARAFGEKGPLTFGPEIPVFFALLLLNGSARTFGWAARAPFLANLVPRSHLANAVTWNSSLFEIGCMTGPAIAGVLMLAFSPGHVYALDALCSLVFVGFLLPIRVRQERHEPRGNPLSELLSGLRFVWKTKAILATITLDLFAVLLGGAVALLPIFADQILHVDARGLGLLRAAPSVGALAMALALAHLPPMRRAGTTLLFAVAGFGMAMVIFGLSESFWLSLAALAVAGAFDNVSVVVRHTLVQLLTPDAMRGRVAAVNNIFIGSSNELGAFESGVTAALFGPVISVVGGGIGTILVVVATALKWPEVRRIGALAPVETSATDASAS
jgi:MFS family permease